MVDETEREEVALEKELTRVNKNTEEHKIRARHQTMQEKEKLEAGRTSRLAMRPREEHEAARTGVWDERAEADLKEGEILELE